MSVGKRKREFEPVPRKACVALTGARKLAEGASNDDPRHSKTSLHEASADGSQRRKLRDMEEERALRECRASANKKPRQSPRMPAGPSDTLRAVENHTSHPTTSNGGLPRVQLPRGNDANSTPASVAGGGIGGNCSVIPREYLEGKISLAELCEFRHHLLLNGNDVDKLAFRILQELLLSPNLGLREDLVGPFSNAMTKATVNQYVSDKGEVCVSMQDIPELLKCRDPTVEHVYQTEQMGDVRGDVWDEGWERSKSEEDRALTMMHENIVYLFRSHDHIDSKDQLAKALNIFRGDTWKQVLNPQGFVPLDRHGQAVMARKHDDICRNDVLLGNLRESLLHRNNEYERVTAGGEGNLHARAPLSCTPSAEGGAEMERYKQSVRG